VKKFHINSELAATAVTTGLLMVPMAGWLPMCAILVGISVSYFIANEVNN
jgi:hypothetical protein